MMNGNHEADIVEGLIIDNLVVKKILWKLILEERKCM